MYPLHLNYTTTLLCKQLLWKLQFFTGETGLPPTAVTSSEKTNGHQTRQTLITMPGDLCLNATRHFNPSQIPSTSRRKSCKQYGKICHNLLTVQNRAKTVYFKTCSKCPPKLSHKLEVFLQSSVCPCWWSFVADLPVLFARLSSARWWYLAWVEMSCSVQA